MFRFANQLGRCAATMFGIANGIDCGGAMN